MSKNIAAYTATSNDSEPPEFVSINHCEKGVAIFVRDPHGNIAEMKMSLHNFATLLIDAAEHMAAYTPIDPNQKNLDV